MRVQWRRLRVGEVDRELIWLLVSVAAAAMAAIWFTFQLPWPRCTFRMLTGLPCFTCGATRVTSAFLQGDFSLWRLNPLIFAALCGLVLFNLYAVVVLVSRAPRLRINAPGERRMTIILLLAVCGANWIYVLAQ